jgi:hypothetical protein
MKLALLSVVLIASLFAASAAGQDLDDPLLIEKLYVTVTTPGDPHPFLLNTSTADLWKLSPFGDDWIYLGDPSGNSERDGTFKLIPYQTGRVLVLDTITGEAWLVDGKAWTEIDRPSARNTRYKGDQKTWNEMWELFKKQSEENKP